MTRDEIMLDEARSGVPAEIYSALEAAGFKPTLDAGNLWFWDRDMVRLCCGDDGSDLPQSMDEFAYAIQMTADSTDEWPILAEGRLSDVLAKISA